MRDSAPLSTDMILLILVTGFTTVIIGVMLVLMRTLQDRSRSSYNEKEKHAELSQMRESFERRIEAITAQLLSSEARWREANHLLLSAQSAVEKGSNRTHGKSQVPATQNAFLAQMGLDGQIAVESKLVFVLTPFDQDFQADYAAIKEACTSVGLKCVRGDEEQATGDIFKHILTLIAKADFVIANITSRNPNVYYELGIAQTLGKDAILVARDKAGLTFDLQSQRVVLYESPADLPEKLKTMLLRTALGRPERI